MALFTAVPALAQDGGVQIVFGLSQRLDTGWNIGLDVPATGNSTLATTRLSFGFSSQTELSQLEFNASSALLVENSFDTGGTETELGRPDLSFAFTREVPNAIFEATARYRSDDAEAFDDSLSAADDTGTRADQGATLRFETGRTAPFGFVVGAAYDASDFSDTSDPGLFDTSVIRGDVAAIFRFSEIAVGTVGLSFARAEDDDLAQTQTETTILTAALDYAVSERLDVAASLGYAEIDSEEFGVTETTSGPVASVGLTYAMVNGSISADLSVTRDADEGARTTFVIGRELDLPAGTLETRIGATHADAAGTDLIGAILWTQDLPSGEVAVRIERSVGFDGGTDETTVNSVAAVDWSVEVNAVSSVAFDLSYEVADAPSERVEQAEFGATYNYALTMDWTLASGLRYVVRDDLDGHAESPSVFLAISRDFAFRP